MANTNPADGVRRALREIRTEADQHGFDATRVDLSRALDHIYELADDALTADAGLKTTGRKIKARKKGGQFQSIRLNGAWGMKLKSSIPSKP